MTTDTLRVIVDGLNMPPFSKNLTFVTFDSLPAQKLLQCLSDVLCWIEGTSEIDIRAEQPDETAMRILNALRILKYPPPRDIDHIQRWRLEIVEGDKTAVYPVLEWIFQGVDRLKERVYLARYLTKIDVPPEEVTPEIQRIQNTIADKMEEFKQIHHRIVESREDFSRAEIVRADLKSMDAEKEQLLRKIERVKKVTSDRGDVKKYLGMAAKLRIETEKGERLALEKQTQRNALVNIEQRVSRLTRLKSDLEKEKDEINPQQLMDKLSRDIDANTYIINEKLANEKEMLLKNIKAVNKIVNIQSVTNSDIANFKKRIEAINAEIIEMTTERDRKDEEHEDKLSIYRHQSQNIVRRKTMIAEEMQQVKRETDEIESKLKEKKADLAKRAGTDDVVTSSQFKRYIAELRTKTTTYKRRKAAMEEYENEAKILQRSVEILNENWGDLQSKLEQQGRAVVEKVNSKSGGRPKTAKPTIRNLDELKGQIRDLNEELTEKRANTQRLSDEINEFVDKNKSFTDQYTAKKSQYAIMKSELEKEHNESQEAVKSLEQQHKRLSEQHTKLEEELNNKQWIRVSASDPEATSRTLAEVQNEHSTTLKEVEQLRTQMIDLGAKASAVEQVAMWKGIVAIFEKKLEVATMSVQSHDGPLGDIY